VAVLEAQSVAWSASGRNAGVVRPGFAAPPEQIVARVGIAHAKALWALSEAGVEYVREAAKDPAMTEVALAETGWLHVARTPSAAAFAARAELLAGQFAATVEPWPAERVRQALASPAYFDGLYYPTAFSLHPLNYALGLAAAAEADGARIFEDTAAVAIDGAGVRKRVQTRDSRVRAAHVVLAGSVHLAGLMPALTATLLPTYLAAAVTAPLGEALAQAIRVPCAVSDTRLADGCYRVLDGGRLLCSGRSAIRNGRPKPRCHALLAGIGRAFPGLGRLEPEHAWTGVVGRTVHGMPQIGEVSPGVWLATGFGDHGLNTTAIGGLMVARAIVEGDQTWRLFNPFALVWAGGAAARATQQAFYWSERGRERIGGMLARRIDRKARRSAAVSGLPGGP
jgi:glycine/D-amino acid oxidase-like deaminating enzyme